MISASVLPGAPSPEWELAHGTGRGWGGEGENILKGKCMPERNCPFIWQIELPVNYKASVKVKRLKHYIGI